MFQKLDQFLSFLVDVCSSTNDFDSPILRHGPRLREQLNLVQTRADQLINEEFHDIEDLNYLILMANYLQKQILFVNIYSCYKFEKFDWCKQKKVYNSCGINICYADDSEHENPQPHRALPNHNNPLVSQLEFAHHQLFINFLIWPEYLLGILSLGVVHGIFSVPVIWLMNGFPKHCVWIGDSLLLLLCTVIVAGWINIKIILRRKIKKFDKLKFETRNLSLQAPSFPCQLSPNIANSPVIMNVMNELQEIRDRWR